MTTLAIAYQYQHHLAADLEIIAELQEDIESSEIEAVMRTLSQHPDITSGSVRFIGRNEAAEIIENQVDTTIVSSDLPNPLSDIIVFRAKNDKALKSIKQGLNIPEVKVIHVQESNLEQLNQSFNTILAGIIILLLATIVGLYAMLKNGIGYLNLKRFTTMEHTPEQWIQLQQYTYQQFQSMVFWIALFVLSFFILTISGILYQFPDFKEYFPLISFVLVGTFIFAVSMGIVWSLKKKYTFPKQS